MKGQYGNSECEWGHQDCINKDIKCLMCLMDSSFYLKPKEKKVGMNKAIKVRESKRQGSMQEVKVYNQTVDAVQGTPNSGAGSIKGDLVIGQMAMVECKTTTKKNEGRQPGKESFSIRRDHLEKLRTEALQARKEFHFLVFSFKEHDNDQYVVSDLDVFNSMIATMKSDRAKADTIDKQINIHKTRSTLADAENVKLTAEIEYLKAKIELLEDKGE